MSTTYHRPPERAVGIKLVVFWLIAGVPLVFGFVNTILDATKLFH